MDKHDDIPFASNNPDRSKITKREFRARGEQWYPLELLPAGITFDVRRLARRSKELWGELCVSVNGSMPNAKTIEGGILSIGDLNFSSVNARTQRAKILADRSRAEGLDWHGFMEEFAFKILAAERKGKPADILADEAEEPDDNETWDIDGFPLLQELPAVLFGAGGSGKSYFAMYLAGRLAELDIPVLYADWEFSKKDHRKRLGRLFTPMPRKLFYVRCDRPMAEEVDRLSSLIIEHKIRYIICDSMVFAVDGRAEDSEQAGIYFRALRSLKIGSLSIAHTTKSEDDNEKKIFGSVFFTNGARSVWFIERATENPRGELQFGLFHRKSNVGELLKPKGYKLVFQMGRTTIERVKIEDVDELAAKLPILDRMKRALKKGAMSVKGLAEVTNSKPNIIRAVVSKHTSTFQRLGDKVGLAASQPVGDDVGF